MKTFPKKLFYKIGEVCDITQVAPHVIRYWETEFSALKPSKNSSGQRIYRYKDVDLILLIKRLLYEEGYTIAGANKKLQSDMVRKRDDRPGAEAAMAVEPGAAHKEPVSKTEFATRTLDELKPVLAELEDAPPDVISHLKSELQSILTLLERK